ncbi:TPA: hypothetical protein ACYSC8_005159 [Citrobacter freundii]|uniref:Uncharacterized protein n=2 Tax=Citrobacter freundii TaxID=546 RepID=A0AAI9MMN3_CITFR|nr:MULTISPECIES: hypothetical protein [Citrobacter]KLV77453.1 hypothetical protein SK39_04577 [Citrobacter sp. BIDMC107]EKU4728654.1 hypothetical protein [Citrobacter freundii]EKV2291868.1 hypothetical protein [Citrobacter freundii]EKV7199670.1 hypothetical protein [Citrobacter freundii]EKW4403967.1 hypothetical protein [Citrobacter freundii]
MSWQGVPFKLLEAGNVDQLFLKLSSLPKLTIDTPTDYNQLALTVGATFLGGIIPALIAWRTFHVNAKNVKKERQEQQKFLQAERAKQHIFMMGERSSQFSSLKEDRELQTSIAQKTINAQVISSNRQNWINELRLNSADFCALAFNHYNIKVDYLLSLHKHQDTTKDFESSAHPETMFEICKEANAEFSNALDELRKSQNKIDKTAFLILLSLNHDEKETQEVDSLIRFINMTADELVVDVDSGQIKNSKDTYVKLIKLTDKFMAVIRSILKREWNRVKLCE